jgi:hypothetical protein
MRRKSRKKVGSTKRVVPLRHLAASKKRRRKKKEVLTSQEVSRIFDVIRSKRLARRRGFMTR